MNFYPDFYFTTYTTIPHAYIMHIIHVSTYMRVYNIYNITIIR